MVFVFRMAGDQRRSVFVFVFVALEIINFEGKYSLNDRDLFDA